jgi:sec-independent protein translocase protein TatA
MGFVSGNHIFLFLIFLVIVLVIFGPGKLPDVGAGMGKAIREFRKASTEVRDSVVNASTEERKADEPAPAPAPTVIAPEQKPTTPVTSSTKTGG